ncbi:general stress protein [Ureibacillus aquaedulcis]|uniref:General stress protein n=1 Tax=Ureibacillus aquaedulcis TaxID=3058421 RepID=A0ABT8GU58_9BACL|nr:general stress protein [Ureibacillus sp. BA0131]MDN4494426.1 general stress protein [Ureibacillus sp. BA0131]
MYSNNMNGSYNIEVAHTTQEAMAIIDRLKNDGIPKGQINIVGKDLVEFTNLKWDADVDVHNAGNFGDKFKAFFTGEDAVMEGLRDADLPESQLLHYKQVVENGGVLIYTDEYIDTTVVERDLNTGLDSYSNERNPLI